MALSLYDISVVPFLQTVAAAEGFLARGLSHFQDTGVDPQTVVETRLFPDMLPFAFQIVSVAHHSLGALEGVRAGVFGPPTGAAGDYTALQQLLADTHAGLKALDRDEVNSWEGKDVTFQMRDFKIPFTAEGFLTSFSMPNVHFHATTAYDILRTKAVPLGKRDYLGALNMKV